MINNTMDAEDTNIQGEGSVARAMIHIPSNAAPSNAAPSNAAPSNAAPSNAAPSNAAPNNAILSNAILSNAVLSNAIPSNAVPINATLHNATLHTTMPCVEDMVSSHNISQPKILDVLAHSIHTYDANSDVLVFEHVLKYPEKIEDYIWLSRHPKLTIDIILKNNHIKWNMSAVSCNPSITMHDVENHPHIKWDWSYLTYNPNLTSEMVLKYPNKGWDNQKLGAMRDLNGSIILARDKMMHFSGITKASDLEFDSFKDNLLNTDWYMDA